MCSEPKHHVNGNRTVEPFPEGTQMAVFGMGCFWGAERKFWILKGVYSTQVGFAGGYTPNPTYKEVCSEKTGHAEVVRVVYQPEHISFEELLKVFWENHDPTQGCRLPDREDLFNGQSCWRGPRWWGRCGCSAEPLWTVRTKELRQKDPESPPQAGLYRQESSCSNYCHFHSV
ncbi:mitochondrial peptide methionine sulfoxide reductase isoform X2 [Marmota monax]|uniref:mitochondrial peptide methionine sulfoxide reductase isoform X2 n=1 Tax=Marmota monax TaxID=9995 RepID=UPI0026F22DC3|nr:mitochondrial peptide methionine sulfoxide reductase isoform X2 [Marmota monax]